MAKLRPASRNWLRLKHEITARQVGLSPAFFDKYMYGKKLKVVGQDRFGYYHVQDPSDPREKLMIHTNHIIK